MNRSTMNVTAKRCGLNALEPRFLAALVALALAAMSCQSMGSSSHAAAPSGDASVDPAKNVARLERQARGASERADAAHAQEHEQGAANALVAARGEAELKDIQDQLAQLEKVDAPARVAKAKLELAQMQDALAEQEEELAQLEMMYKESDLADKTREIVLNRGKRRVERAKEKLELQARDVQALGETILPHEHDKLARQLELKRRDLERVQREGEMQLHEQHIASESAEIEVMRAEAELAAAQRGGAK